MTTPIEARFLRHGDVITLDDEQRTIKRTRERKSDRTINVFFVNDTEHRFLAEDYVDVVRRDALTFPTGPGATRYGR